LATDAYRRNLSSLDESIDRSQVDLEVLQDFFGRQEDFVVWKIESQAVR
jgi:hypothetical protein